MIATNEDGEGVCVWGLATVGPASWTVKRESRRGPATRSQPGVRTVKGVGAGLGDAGRRSRLDGEGGVGVGSGDPRRGELDGQEGVKVTSGDLEPTWSEDLKGG